MMVKKSIKIYLIRMRTLFFNRVYDLEWLFSQSRRKNSCLDYSERNPDIVVSLTSFPERIRLVHKTIRSILNQKNVKPNFVELWLAKEQFPNGESSIPENLRSLKELGLKICWCEDIKSYKKLIPVIACHPESIIVTADDDVYYNRDWLECLYNAYLQDRHSIQCHRATKFYIKNGEFKTIPGGYQFYDKPSFLNKLVGIGGVLYPPHSLYKDILEKELFTTLAPTNDDIWFWFMAILNNTYINVVQNNAPQPVEVFEANNSPKLTTINDNGKKLFWIQFDNLLKYYPEIEKKLRSEYDKFSQSNAKSMIF